MRGDAQDVLMDYNAIQTICKKTGHIKHLNITGGEPSLVPDALKYLLFYLKSYSCRIGEFFCATNAQEYSKEFADALTDLYYYCEHPELCMLTISIDQFHSAADPLALQEYRKLPFYNPTVRPLQKRFPRQLRRILRNMMCFCFRTMVL